MALEPRQSPEPVGVNAAGMPFAQYVPAPVPAGLVVPTRCRMPTGPQPTGPPVRPAATAALGAPPVEEGPVEKRSSCAWVYVSSYCVSGPVVEPITAL